MSDTSEQIERQTESRRANIAELLGELRQRATPGEVVDNLFGWDAGRETVRTLGNQVRGNPLPLALIGIGIAWLMASDGSKRSERPLTEAEMNQAIGYGMSPPEPQTESATDTARDFAGRMKDKTETLASEAGDAAGTLADKAEQAMDTVKNGAASAMDKASSAMDQTMAAGESVQRSLNMLLEEQPLVLAGLGFALGLAAGAVVPMTDTENDLLGELSDDVRKSAAAVATGTYEDAKAAVQDAAEAVSEELPLNADSSGSALDPSAPDDVRNGDGSASGFTSRYH